MVFLEETGGFTIEIESYETDGSNHSIDLTYKGGVLLTIAAIARFILPSCQNWNGTMH